MLREYEKDPNKIWRNRYLAIEEIIKIRKELDKCI